MSRATHIRQVIGMLGPQTIDKLASLCEAPRIKIAKTVRDMESDGLLVRVRGDHFGLGRPLVDRKEQNRRAGEAIAEMHRRLPPPDGLWQAWRAHPVPAINPAPLRWAA